MTARDRTRTYAWFYLQINTIRAVMAGDPRRDACVEIFLRGFAFEDTGVKWVL